MGDASGRLPVELETANPLTPELEQELLPRSADVLGADPIVSAAGESRLDRGLRHSRRRPRVRRLDANAARSMRKGMIARANEAIQRSPERFVTNTQA